MTFKVIYGIESQEKECINNPTVGQVIQDPVLKAVFGWGDNLRAMIHGVEQPATAIVPEGADVVIETKANSKAN